MTPDTSGFDTPLVLRGPLREPRQMLADQEYGGHASIHDDRMAEILETTQPNIRRKISEARFEIPTYIDNGKRWADIRDVAEYLDQRRQEARLVHGASPRASIERSA